MPVVAPATAGTPGAVVLVAHGSADPRAAATTRELAGAVAAARPGLVVETAYLDHTQPRPDRALAALAAAGAGPIAVVPLLLTAAYHSRVDLPAVLARARDRGLPAAVGVTDVLGPVGGVVPEPLVAGLRRRLSEGLPDGGLGGLYEGLYEDLRPAVRSPAGVAAAHAGPGAPARPYDAVVLAAAGTRDVAARATVDEAAGRLRTELGVPCLAAYASGEGPSPGEAVAALRDAGARRVAMAAYFLATGQLYRAAADAARVAGAVAVARPLAAAPELARLVLSRMDALAGPAGGPTAPIAIARTARTAERPGCLNTRGVKLCGLVGDLRMRGRAELPRGA